jgi:hypothetical protein
MPTVRCFFVALMFAAGLVAQSGVGPPPPKSFMGRPITVVVPKLDADGFYPLGPASICVEGPPLRQCYTAPEDFGRAPKVEIVQIDTATSALLFSAESGGVSGFMVHYALLLPGTGPELEDLFFQNLSVSEQSQSRFIGAPAISKAPIFVTADYIMAPDESHHGPHRYISSAYVSRYSREMQRLYYTLEDQYMTILRYDTFSTRGIIASEEKELLARLERVTSKQSKRPVRR